jgi:hypothetical protein
MKVKVEQEEAKNQKSVQVGKHGQMDSKQGFSIND